LPHKAFPANQAKPGLEKFAAIYAQCPMHCKNFLCPAIAHKATIVLPDFARSCSTDGDAASLLEILQHKATIVLPDFVRSCSTDGDAASLLEILQHKATIVLPDFARSCSLTREIVSDAILYSYIRYRDF